MRNKHNKDIFEMLIEDHQEIADLIQTIEDADTRDRKKFFEVARDKLQAHSRAEESTLYRLLESNSETAQLGGECEEDHATINEALMTLERQLKADDVSSSYWDTFAALREAVSRHVQKEEGTVFENLKTHFAPEHINDLARDFVRAKSKLERKAAA